MEDFEKLCQAQREGCRKEINVELEKLCLKVEGNQRIMELYQKTNEKALNIAQGLQDEKFKNITEKLDNIVALSNRLDGKMVMIIVIIPLIVSSIVSLISLVAVHLWK